jgi:predicted AlkP superfamily pyrophosphatase or phosphodiesterase
MEEDLVQRRCRPITRLLAATLLPIALCALASTGAGSQNAAGAEPPPLILISFDGYRADYLQRGHSPVLAALAADGVRAEGLRPAYPSLTFPNHYTMVTGLYPDQHGIVNNSMRDPVLGTFSPANRASNTDGRWWDQAEPIWVTASKQDRRTASVFWPGTQAEIRGIRPTYWQSYDPTVQPDARVDQVLQWLDLPKEQRPSFVSLYFEHTDVAGHFYGPDSLQVDEALATVDAALGHLVDGLKQRNSFDSTNLVIVSDHGMSATSPERMVLLDSIVNLDHVEIASALVNLGLDPKPGYAPEVEHAMLAPHPHLQCWKKERMPKQFHYGTNARIPAIQCVTEDGWMVSTAAIESKRARPLLGEHGYDSKDPRMLALFVAHGPSFKQHLTVPVFDNVNVYGLLAKLMGIQPAPNAGKPEVVAGMLRMVALPSTP